MSKRTKETKITQLNTEYAKEQYVHFQRQQRQLVFKKRRLTAILGITLVVFTIVGFQLFSDYQRLQKLTDLKVETQQEQQAAEENLEDLQMDIELLKDESYVAKLARRDYYYSRPGESVYIYTPKKADEAISSNPTTNAEADGANENQGNE
ncbi:cell division protein DivIC [Enterococcus sp. PF1-24]|uniref:FtsB family cell division protein n=1 Tax=unclassified Enterococcus TaxID=2608891 RepID=UPI0024769AA0|nr:MULTISPECIES: septum formation initiator family protein [unclassified Enterococcus]MDH6363921.1 cell division protein DivIC [Enterococcus sp. PFB1-1]MDH6401022.1 cell division protein DivIC [Enterococcus sp. PF1-24]